MTLRVNFLPWQEYPEIIFENKRDLMFLNDGGLGFGKLACLGLCKISASYAKSYGEAADHMKIGMLFYFPVAMVKYHQKLTQITKDLFQLRVQEKSSPWQRTQGCRRSKETHDTHSQVAERGMDACDYLIFSILYTLTSLSKEEYSSELR